MNWRNKNNLWDGSTGRQAKTGYHSENPWDGDDKMTSTPRIKTCSTANLFKSWFIFTLIITLSILLLAGISKAGKVIEKSADKSSSSSSDTRRSRPDGKESPAPKDKDMAEIAEEYAYLVEQLMYLSTDYCRYFERLDDQSAADNYKALADMCSRISKEDQYENASNLLGEITTLNQQLKDRERELLQLQNELESQSSEYRKARANRKALKLTSSLREELQSLNEQIEREVVWKIEKSSYNEATVQEYVRAIINDSLIKYVGNMAKTFVPVVRVEKDRNGNPTAVVVEVPPVPDENPTYAVEMPAPASSPTPHSIPTPPSIGYSNDFKFFKKFDDSLSINSKTIDISITNAIGNVIVTNSPNGQVYTSYRIGVAAENSDQLKKFSDQIELRMYPKANKVFVETVVPSVGNPAIMIIESDLEVSVPKENPVMVSNASGNVSVNDLSNDVSVKSNSGNIDIYRLTGNLALTNSAGTVNLGKVSGGISLQNRMGPIALSRCEGAIEIDNSLGQVSLEDCRGDVVIRNTGPINIENHVGEVEITNRNGLISIANVKGNLAVLNSFQTVAVNNINGAAKIINTNALITLEEITGVTTVNNRFGNITGIALDGPINIENKSGNITLNLSRQLTGNSSIMSNGGNIILAITPGNNLLINLESLGGSIDITGFDSNVGVGSSGSKTATLSLGKGANSLAVKATGSNILVDRSE